MRSLPDAWLKRPTDITCALLRAQAGFSMGAMQAAKLLAELGAGERALSAPAPAAMLASSAACAALQCSYASCLQLAECQPFAGLVGTGWVWI